jgi:hypothetical protein
LLPVQGRAYYPVLGIAQLWCATCHFWRLRKHELKSRVGRKEARDVVAVPVTNDVLRSFHQDTARLAAGILSAVVCAALVLAAALIQEGHSKAVDQPTEETQTGVKALVNAADGPRRDGPPQQGTWATT